MSDGRALVHRESLAAMAAFAVTAPGGWVVAGAAARWRVGKAMNRGQALQGEAWDLASEYPSADSARVEDDLAAVDQLLGEVERRNNTLAPLVEAGAVEGTGATPSWTIDGTATAIAEAQAIFGLLEQANKPLEDLDTYAACLLSVNSQDHAGQGLLGRLQSMHQRFAEAGEPLSQFLDRAPQSVVDAYLAHDRTAPSRFQVAHSRKRRHEILPLEQETLAASLAQDGLHAWGRLYDQLAGSLACAVTVNGEERRMGLAAASALMLKADSQLRENAWRAVNRAWEEHTAACAAGINAIAGWRLEMCRRRSRQTRAAGGRDVHFLDAAVHANHIERATLDTVLGIAEEGRALARRAARLQAKAYGKARYGPWDLRAPAPTPAGGADDGIAYSEAVEMIAQAYGDVHPRMGEFVRMMAKNRWIEGTLGDTKRPGAYCTGFLKSRAPRVYMTYAGGASDVIILAHELGHAFHAWTMRNLPECQRHHGMAIAETASTFGEATVREALLRRAKTPAERLGIVWEEAAALTSFLLNIPTRFEFERNFYEARAERPQRADEIKALMVAAWETGYGDSLAEPDPLFWASKLHFYISDSSFYNFPYLFGYLFSLGVHAQRDALGDAFFSRYEALLLDTGRMTAEELAAKHLQVDLTRPEFWRGTLERLAKRIDLFEMLVEEAESGRTAAEDNR